MEDRILSILKTFMGSIVARAILTRSLKECNIHPESIEEGDRTMLLLSLGKGIKVFIPEEQLREECLSSLRSALNVEQNSYRGTVTAAAPGEAKSIRGDINRESDIFMLRSQVWIVCEKYAIEKNNRTRITTTISELARNILQYAGTGTIDVTFLPGGRKSIEITARDRGPGISDLDAVLSGIYVPTPGTELGLRGVKNLVDQFTIDSAPGKGTVVRAVIELS